MANIADLNQYRQAKQVKFAEDNGWDVVAHFDESLANVLVYSIDYNGRIRFSGQLLQSAVRRMDEIRAMLETGV